MKKLLILIFSIFLFISCNLECDSKHNDNLKAQEFFNKNIRESHIMNKEGHDIILYEVGWRGSRYYSMSIEHNPICRKCLDFYD